MRETEIKVEISDCSMKSIIALVVILHLCHSCYNRQSLKAEMIHGLTAFNKELRSGNYLNTVSMIVGVILSSQ